MSRLQLPVKENNEMAKLPRITINIAEGYGYTPAQLDSLKKAFNVRLASIHAARQAESDSPVGETNVSRTPATKKRRPAKSKSSAKKK
jgi:hypothetical protein